MLDIKEEKLLIKLTSVFGAVSLNTFLNTPGYLFF